MFSRISFSGKSVKKSPASDSALSSPSSAGLGSPVMGVNLNGDVMASVKAKYLGVVSVENPSGSEVAIQASTRVRNNPQKQEAVKVYLTIKSQEVILINRDSGDVVQNTPIRALTWTGLDPTDRKQVIYIARSKAGVLYAHVFQIKDRALEVVQMLGSTMTAIAIADEEASKRGGALHRQPSRAVSAPLSPMLNSPAPGIAATGATSPAEGGFRRTPSINPSPQGFPMQGMPGMQGMQVAGGLPFDAAYLGQEKVVKNMGLDVVKEALKRNDEARARIQVRCVCMCVYSFRLGLTSICSFLSCHA
jgi:hypothetical protein